MKKNCHAKEEPQRNIQVLQNLMQTVVNINAAIDFNQMDLDVKEQLNKNQEEFKMNKIQDCCKNCKNLIVLIICKWINTADLSDMLQFILGMLKFIKYQNQIRGSRKLQKICFRKTLN